MTQKMNLTSDQPIVHIKAYGGIIMEGHDQNEIVCEIEAPQLATMVEENGHVYITVNSSCSVTLPMLSSIIIERGMGSIEIRNIKNKIEIEKALGNLLLKEIKEAAVEKVGGNFAVRKATGSVTVEKVGGNLVLEDVGSFTCEKIGGSCFSRNIQGDLTLEKAGGSVKAQNIGGVIRISRLGGSFIAKDVTVGEDIRAGGDILIKNFEIGKKDLSFKAGGCIHLEFGDDFGGCAFSMHSGVHQIRIALGNDDLSIGEESYDYQMGNTDRIVEMAAGGDISLTGISDPGEDVVGDLSDFFDFEKSPFSEMIRDRIDYATRKAEAKVRAAQIRLDQMQDRLEKKRFPKIHTDFEAIMGKLSPERPEPPMPPVSRPAGRKGASDEERLMILKMLQDKKITVDDAEKLFIALEK